MRLQEVKAPRFQDSRKMKAIELSAPRTSRLYSPRKYSPYSFLVEAESTPGPYCDRKGNVIEKFRWHHRESNFLPGVVRIIEVRMIDGRVIDALLYLVPLSGIEPRFHVSPDHSLDTIPTAI